MRVELTRQQAFKVSVAIDGRTFERMYLSDSVAGLHATKIKRLLGKPVDHIVSSLNYNGFREVDWKERAA